jgi:cell division protein FtsB
MTDTAQTQVRPSGDDTPRGQTGARVRRRVRTGAGDGRRRKRIWTYGLLLLSAGLMVNALIGEKGYLANLQARQEFQDVSESLRQLKAENARLEEDARRMRTDPRALEDAARSQLGLVKPGETLITLRDRPATRD